MAYFNHAFNKLFLGTSVNAGGNVNLAGPGAGGSAGGFLITAGLPSVTLTHKSLTDPNDYYGPGTFGFFNPETWESIDPTLSGYSGCCPIVLIAAPLVSSDKIGPFAGGYQETNKSKTINPKYVQKIYKVSACTPQQSVTSIGNTPFTHCNADPKCCFTFLCSETYYLRIDVKGSPALRFLNHQAYQNIFAYTGCCPADPAASLEVDSTLVMIDWATQIINNPYLSPFIAPIVYSETQVGGNAVWFAPGTTVNPIDGTAVTSAEWWDAYVSPGHTADACAGLRLVGAYVDTKFGNCSFQVTDFYEKEIVSIFASLVDINGDPCTFEGICVYNDCNGVQGIGFGETVVRDLILSESYLQNFFASNDMRIREITQGDQILGSVDRNALYTRYYILHSVPRFNNPTGVFDNDRYLLEIIIAEPNPLAPVGNAALETFLNAWSSLCSDCVTPTTFDCVHCTIEADAGYNPQAPC